MKSPLMRAFLCTVVKLIVSYSVNHSATKNNFVA